MTMDINEYRGKHIITGEWLKGSLYNDGGEEYILPNIPGSALDYEDYQVNPNTVGQLTGVLDVKGNKIFKGDILKVTDIYEPQYCQVMWCEESAHFYVDYGRNEHVMLGFVTRNSRTIEIVGNIYDNPEFLKGR